MTQTLTVDNDIIKQSLTTPASFASIFDRHSAAIGGYAARRVGPTAAEDIVSETFLIAFRKRESYDLDVPSALPWLYGIASRLIRKHRADEAKHWRDVTASVAAEPRPQDSTNEVVNRVDAQARIEQLRTRIAKLSEADRETLLLYACEQLSYEEVAHVQGVPLGTVRSRLNRVRRKLDRNRTTKTRGGESGER